MASIVEVLATLTAMIWHGLVYSKLRTWGFVFVGALLLPGFFSHNGPPSDAATVFVISVWFVVLLAIMFKVLQFLYNFKVAYSIPKVNERGLKIKRLINPPLIKSVDDRKLDLLYGAGNWNPENRQPYTSTFDKATYLASLVARVAAASSKPSQHDVQSQKIEALKAIQRQTNPRMIYDHNHWREKLSDEFPKRKNTTSR